MVTWPQVQALIAQLPETREETGKTGQLSWRTGKRAFAWERPLRKSDLQALGEKAPRGPILGVRTADLEMKEAMLASGKRGLFTTPHFDGYAAVLVALDVVSAATLKAVLVDAWLAQVSPVLGDAYLAQKRKR